MTNIGLVDFLRARLNEDFRVAKTPTHATWATPSWEYHEGPEGPYVNLGTNHLDRVSSLNDVEMKHIARHDPARVLAEVEAKRKLIDLHHDVEDTQEMVDLCAVCEPTGKYPEYPCQTLRLLALPYASHPDYRTEEWRP